MVNMTLSGQVFRPATGKPCKPVLPVHGSDCRRLNRLPHQYAHWRGGQVVTHKSCRRADEPIRANDQLPNHSYGSNSSTALWTSLGEKKAKEVNPDSKSGVEPRRRLNGILVTFRQLLHPGTPSAALTLVSLSTGSGKPGRECEADPAQASLTIIQVTRKSWHHHRSTPKPYCERETAKQQVRIHWQL